MKKQEVKVIFFGTPEFAVPTLEMLHQEYNVIACVTQTDKPAGRGQKQVMSAVKKYALEHDIQIIQPNSLKNSKAIETHKLLNDLEPDVCVVVSYGKIIPKDILQIPKYGFINIHYSLLPLLRGASPIQTAILQGHKETGITIMLMDEGLDTGPILTQQSIPIESFDTSETLHDKLKKIGVDLLNETLIDYIDGNIKPIDQDHAKATHSSLIDKKDGEIDWGKSDEQIENQIRAFTPWPSSYTFCRNKRVKIIAAHIENEKIMIDQVQPEGKKIMDYQDFLKGYNDCPLPPVN